MSLRPRVASDAKPKSRKTTQLPSLMDHRLAAYALVAAAAAAVPAFAQAASNVPAYIPTTATGVGLPAFAENRPNAIVYTPASISFMGSYALGKNVGIDFNGDGITDISIQGYGYGAGGEQHFSTFRTGGVKWVGSAMSHALAKGEQIGPRANFSGRNLMARSEWHRSPSSNRICYGPFHDANTKYLGVRFSIDGETHFGWVNIYAKCGGGGAKDTFVFGGVNGYAYNTIPNEPIDAGQVYAKPPEEGDATEPSAPEPGTLGALSLGSVLRR